MNQNNFQSETAKENTNSRVIILGAGLTGLGAAYKLTAAGIPCSIYEAADRVGGFATSFSFKECTFDYGPHAFHSHNLELLEFYLEFMGDEVLHLNKHVEIKFRDKFYDYPIKPLNLLKNLNTFVLLHCGTSFFWQTIRKIFIKTHQTGSLEELFITLYGKALYQLFFEKYTEKVWGFHPRNLSNTFLKYRLPSYNLFQMAINALKDFFGIGERGELSKDSFVKMQYYPRFGAGTFPEKLRRVIIERGGIIHLNSNVQKIKIKDGKITGIHILRNGSIEEIPCDVCITTIPITHFVKFFEPAPPDHIIHAVEQLYFRAIIIYCIVVRRNSVIHCDALYFHDRIFHRVGQMNSYSKDTVPQGKSAITVEVACFYGDPLWNMDEKELYQWMLKDLKEEGFDIQNEVEDYFILRKEYGYPAPTLGYEKHLADVFTYLNNISNLYSGGRQALFTYIQMFHALQMGFKIADSINQGVPKPKFETDNNGKKLAGKDPYFV